MESLLRLHRTIDNEDIVAGVAAKCNNDVRFGKFLLGLLKKLDAAISVRLRSILSERVSQHSSFLKKALETELKKKAVKS